MWAKLKNWCMLYFKGIIYPNIKMSYITWPPCHYKNVEKHIIVFWLKDILLLRSPWSGAAGLSAGAAAVVASVGGAAGAVVGGAADLLSRSKSPPSPEEEDYEEEEEIEMTQELMLK